MPKDCNGVVQHESLTITIIVSQTTMPKDCNDHAATVFDNYNHGAQATAYQCLRIAMVFFGLSL